MTGFVTTLIDRRKLGYLTTGVLAFALLLWLVVAPLASVLSRSFLNDSGALTGANWGALGDADNGEAIGNSLLLAISVTVFSSVLALPSAWIIARTPLRKLWWLDLVLMVPFMVPPYINSMGWMLFMQRGGILRQMWSGFAPLGNAFMSFYGMVFIMSMHTYPFLLTMMKGAFLAFPRNLDDAMSVYSSSKIQRLTKVYMPIFFPNYLIGAFLVFVKALSEYGTPATFGTQIHFTVFTTLITNKMSVAPIDFGQAASMASILVLICMVLWALQVFVTEKKSYALNQGQSSEITGRKTSLIVGSVFLAILFLISAGIPLFSIIATSFKKVISRGLYWENLTGKNYVDAFTDSSLFQPGYIVLLNTLEIGVWTGLFTFVLGLAFAIYSFNHKSTKAGKGVEFLSLLPEMIPNIVTGIGLIMFYNAIYQAFPIYRTKWMLVLGYTVIFLPNVVSYVKSALLAMPRSLVDAGTVFTKSQARIDLRIVAPMALKGAFYGTAMTFIVSFRELVTAKLLTPPSYYVLSTYINIQFEQGSSQAAMAMAVVSVALTLCLLLPLEFLMMKDSLGKAKKKEA